MQADKTLLAWIKRERDSVYQACFVAASATGREPATTACHSREEGQRWVEREAETVGASVQWIEPRD